MANDNIPELQSIWDEARHHIERHDYDKAIEIYKYILIRYPDEFVAVEYANAYLGDIFLTTRRLDLAEIHLQKAIDMSPENAHYHYLLAFTYSVKSQWAKSVTEFRKAVKLEPFNSEYHRGLGWAVFNKGNKTAGIDHLYRSLDLSPVNINAMTDIAAAMLIMGNLKKAREYGEKALRLDPNYVLARDLIRTIDRIETDPGFAG